MTVERDESPSNSLLAISGHDFFRLVPPSLWNEVSRRWSPCRWVGVNPRCIPAYPGTFGDVDVAAEIGWLQSYPIDQLGYRWVYSKQLADHGCQVWKLVQDFRSRVSDAGGENLSAELVLECLRVDKSVCLREMSHCMIVQQLSPRMDSPDRVQIARTSSLTTAGYFHVLLRRRS